MISDLLNLENSFDALLGTLPEDPDVPKVRGDAFEKVCQWFLKNDPQYSGLFKNVWLWYDWPGRWGADLGIDLVAETQEGELWAIQAKGYNPDNQVPTPEINSFISASGRSEFDYRLLISSGSISSIAEKLLNSQEKQTGYLLYSELANRPLNWLAYFDQDIPAVPVKASPRAHQISAIDDVLAGFLAADRGQLIMACGTGKTLAGLWVDEGLGNSSTLVFVPSLSLISQVAQNWHTNRADYFDTLYVCSDETVKDDNDTFVANTGQLGSPVTTDPEEIRQFLSGPGKRVVFSTYQSSPQIVEAQRGRDYEFDLVICDEAHHCAVSSKKESPFTLVLDENQILAKKRLFMTATPRTMTRRVIDASKQHDIQTASMDDETLFGTRFHTLTFGEAIAGDLLNDYRIVVIGVTKSETRQLVENRRLVELEDTDLVDDAESLACMLALTKVIKQYELQRILGFHSRISRSTRFTNSFSSLNTRLGPDESLPDLWVDHVTGKMPAGERNRLLKQFNSGQSQVNLLNNVRCLGEGIDVPDIDGIVFVDSKNSVIDIAQAVGRAIRKTDPPKLGTIVVPVLIDDTSGISIDEQLGESRFDKIWQVLNALRSHDEILQEDLDKLRYEIGRYGRIVGGCPKRS